jgi:hypothetical protein
VLETITIIAILAKIGVHNQITVFAGTGVVNVIGIHACTLGI